MNMIPFPVAIYMHIYIPFISIIVNIPFSSMHFMFIAVLNIDLSLSKRLYVSIFHI